MGGVGSEQPVGFAYDNQDMNTEETFVEVESKGIVWLVAKSGRVRAPSHTTTYSRTRNGKTQTFTVSFKERDLTPCDDGNGYLEVSTVRDGKRFRVRVHRLVALAFVSGHQEGLTVNHKDGRKTNNDPQNLEWVSLSENTTHQWETGLVDCRGEKSGGAKLTSRQVVYIRRLLAEGVPAHALAVVAGVSMRTISLIRDGKRWASV